MAAVTLGDITLNWREWGNPEGAPVVFAHGHGLDLRLWEGMIAALPQNLRLIAYDLRGHGGSSVGAGSMGAMIRDAEQLLEFLGVRDCVFVGHGLGGMVAQGLAVKRLDLVRAMVLAQTSMKLGVPSVWTRVIEQVSAGGMASVARDLHARWFARANRASDLGRLWAARLMEQSPEGYIEAVRAISGTDFYTPTARLTLPSLVIGAYDDGVVPPDLVQETAGLIKGADYLLLRRAGHMAPVEAPEEMAQAIGAFLQRIGHAAGLTPEREAPVVEPSSGCGEDCYCEGGACGEHAHQHGAGCGCH